MRYTLYLDELILDVSRKQARRLLSRVIMRARSCEARPRGTRCYVGKQGLVVFNLVIAREV